MANPHNREAHDRLCKLLEKQRKFRQADEERKAWLEDNPSDYFELISLISSAQVYLFDPEYAVIAAKQFLSNQKPEDTYYAWTNDQIGRLLIERQRPVEAIPYLQTAAKADPKVSDYWSHLSSAYLGAKRFDEAVATINRSLELYPGSASSHVQLGDALAAKGDLEAQETEYKAACNIDKDDPLLKTVRARRYVSLAKLQTKRKEFSEATATAAIALQLDPDDPYAYLVVAQAMHSQGRDAEATAERDKAETYIKQAMMKEKKPLDLAVPLAIFIDDDAPELIRLLEPAEKSLSAIEKVLLATGYFAAGAPEIGEAEFNKALENPKMNTAQAHFTLAGLLRQAQSTEKAVKEYSTAYAMDPENLTYR